MILFLIQFNPCINHQVVLYIDSPDWIKKKKTIINLKKGDDKCLQYAATVALNYKEIESHPERVSNIKPLINKYN